MDVISLAKINELKKSGGVGYEETKLVEALEEATVELAYMEEAEMLVGILPFIEVEKGCKVKVVFDGVTYDTEYRYVAFEDGTSCEGIGNLAFAGFEDTGEPFLIAPAEGDGMSMLLCEEGTHTVSVSVEQTTVHKVDPKFSVPQGYELVDLSNFTLPNVGETSVVANLADDFSKILAIFEKGLVPLCYLKRSDVDLYTIPVSHGTNNLGDRYVIFELRYLREDSGETFVYNDMFCLYCSDGRYYVKR